MKKKSKKSSSFLLFLIAKVLGVFCILIFLIFIGVFFIKEWPKPILGASDPINLLGYVWSENIGWVSLNCENEDVCDSIGYGLIVDPDSGEITGYAWSSNIGWICFGATCSAHPPTTPPSGSLIASFDENTSKVWGWARILALGDEGWIRLRGNGVSTAGNFPECLDCVWGGTICGNNRLETGEDCDDGNTINGDGCNYICLNEGSSAGAICGNGGEPETGEDCDDGNTSGGDGCSSNCINEGSTGSAVCGNGGELEIGEDCDDGNTSGGDGCSSNCINEGANILNTCNICFKNAVYGGSDNICNSCSNCALSDVNNSCAYCEECDFYGVSLDRTTGFFKGWGWNGTDNGTGIGWFQFGPRTAEIKSNWLETFYGDVYSRKDITMPENVSGLLRRFNATFCVQANGEITNFSSQTGCLQAEEEFELELPKRTTGYASVLGKIDVEGHITKVNGNFNKYGLEVVDCSALESGGSIRLDRKIYYCGEDNDLTISNNISINNTHGAGTVIVDGDLYIENDITYSSGVLLPVHSLKDLASIGWIVTDISQAGGGDINILPNVEEIVGAFYAEGTIRTGTTGDSDTDELLTVKGLMIANAFYFDRLARSSTRGAEQIVYDGRAVANVPPGMEDLTKGLPLFKEVVP